MGKKVKKGDFGYIQAKRKQVIIRTILYFAAALSVFLIGYLHTGTRKNLLTVIAVLGCLPSCKSAVNMIMFLRAKGCSRETADKIQGYVGILKGMFDMYFTSYQKNFPICHLVITDHTVIGFSEFPDCDCKAAQEHLETMLKQGSLSDVKVSISDQLERYCSQLAEMNRKYQGTEFVQADEIGELLGDISL